MWRVILTLLLASQASAQMWPTPGPGHTSYGTPIAYDQSSTSGVVSAADPSWTHTPVGAPKGVIVFCIVNGSSTDEFTGATYGGTSMTRIASAADTTTELGFTEAYFLGDLTSLQGAKTVVCDGAATGDYWAAAVTFTASGNLATAGDGSCTVSNNAANPSCNIANQTTATMAAAALFSGIASEANITAGTGFTKRQTDDTGFAAQSTVMEVMTVQQASGTVTAAFTAGSDDVAMVAVAVKVAP